MMKQATFALAVALAWSVAADAQSGSTPTGQPTSRAAKPDATMVTGCLAQGTAPDTFVLNNAMKADAMVKDTAPTPDKTKSGEAGMAMSYTLVGGDNLKAHVGHKVTVTGTPDKTSSMSGERTGTTPPASGTPSATAHDMKGGTLKVQTVKMVSTTCP